MCEYISNVLIRLIVPRLWGAIQKMFSVRRCSQSENTLSQKILSARVVALRLTASMIPYTKPFEKGFTIIKSTMQFHSLQQPTFYFIGVTTGKSSIMKIFPQWMEILGRPEVRIEGIDHRIHDDPAAYRATIAQIKHDPLAVGGLITTHKMDVYAAAQELFDYLDPYAQQTHEVSSISKRNGRFEGHAFDPITAGVTLDTILGADYFGRTGADMLCFGAGGAASALLLNLIQRRAKGERPRRFIAVDRNQSRLAHLGEMAQAMATDIQVELILNDDARRNDALLAELPAHSLVVNATGMGKDLPGSPISDAGVFPCNGIVWEFNYRGELDFLQQAMRQQQSATFRSKMAGSTFYTAGHRSLPMSCRSS